MLRFFYAYVANGSVAFNPVTHAEKDERVYGVDFQHNEGEFATLKLLIRNPKIGLLHESRFQWLWFSYQQDAGPVTPLFFGRLEGLPANLQDETLTLVYKAQPADFETQKIALAESLKVFPYYDPIWFNPEQRSDPEVVLQARTARWHIDPITHDVTISDIIVGEDGTVNVESSEQYYKSMRFGFSGQPLVSLNVEATVDWQQTARGAIDLKRQLQLAFAAAGSPDGLITSYTGQGLQSTWPLTGDRIGGGWSFGLSYSGEPSGASPRPPEDEQQPESRFTRPLSEVGMFRLNLVPNQSEDDDGISTNIINPPEDDAGQLTVFFSRWKFKPPYFDVAYEASRSRKEILSFTLVADVQTIILGNERSESFAISSSYVAEIMGEGTGDQELALGSHSARRYFDTDRGKQSLSWLIALARARLCFAARCVTVGIDVPWSKFLQLSLRKNALIADDRLPGGEAGGKIVGYGFSLSKGQLKCSVEIAGTVGNGNELIAAQSGEPTYVEEGHYEPGEYQQYSGAQIVPIDGAVLYDDFQGVIDDDGIDFADMRPETVIEGARAEAKFTLNQLPVALQTVTIAGTVYTWKAAADAPNAVRIGYTTDDSIVNLICAVLALENFEGLRYGDGTVKNPNVTARLGDQNNTMVAIATDPGTEGNSLAVSASGAGSWSSATLLGGLPKPRGLRVINGESAQEEILGETYEDKEAAEKALNDNYTRVKMELINLIGGPFETIYNLGDLDLMIQKTVDLEAPSVI